jgi:hypothetical protein
VLGAFDGYTDSALVVRVLQYRSVAFVTYVHEVHAQFAKEAMACQSLDNDEILNVRWATEDPNPVQKVAEKRRLEDMGQEAIRARMDPRIVDAMRAVRALEDGEVLAEDADERDDVDIDIQSDPKRPRFEEQPSDEVPAPAGLLNSDTLEGLKYFAEIRRHNGYSPAPPPKSASSGTPSGTSGLALVDYGSDDE